MTNSRSGADGATRYLAVPEGRVAYHRQGSGPLLVLLPGMGELRSTYRHLTPALVAAGYTVVTADLRGHGDSDMGFSSYGDTDTAADLIALLRELGEPAVVVGNSMSAGAAVIAAAEQPGLISGLVLVGPFVRNPAHVSKPQKALFAAMMGGPWARVAWLAYLPTLYRGRKPEDFAAYRDEVAAALKRPGYTAAFRHTTRTDHAPAAVALTAIGAAAAPVPSLVVMGTEDPDFPDPFAEATWIATTLGGTVIMVDDAGHYPHAQQPEATAAAILDFLGRLTPDA